MKISRDFEPFGREQALIVACGSTKARIHYAHQGMVDYLGSVRVAVPKYSDREGFFLSTGRGLVLRSGAVYEDQKQERHEQFLREVLEQVSRHISNHHVTSLYVFCPEHTLAETTAAFEKKFSKLVRLVLPGAFVNEHPFVLMKKIEAARADAFAVLHQARSPTERTFLRRTRIGSRLSKLRKRSPFK